jgi:PAS domain-containing protein
MRRVIKLSLHDSALGFIRELDALFDQSPIAMVFNDRELRARRTNAAFRRLTGLPDEAITGGLQRSTAAREPHPVGGFVTHRPAWRRSTAFSCRSTNSSASLARSRRNMRAARLSIRRTSR